MKKLLFLILLFSVIKVFAVSPPVIQNPTPLQVCDNNNDGTAVFDLTTKIGEVLGALNPSLYSVSFHETQTDAAVGGTTIPNPASFVNINAFTQTVYVRVQENLSGEYSIASLDLIVNPTPIIGQPQNISIEQIPFTGTAVFDLTSNDGPLLNGLTGATIAYFTTLIDAQNNTNQIAIAVGLDPAAFIGTNGQIIWARVELATTQCASFASFHLYITNPDIVFIPDANFKQALLTADGSTQSAQDLNHNYTVIDTNSDGEIEYNEAANISLLNVSQRDIADLTGLEAFTNIAWLNTGYNATLTTINTSAMPLLEQLSTSHCNLNTLDFSNNPNLQSINCEFNNLSSLDFSSSPLMTYIHCQNNQLTTLNLTGLTLLNNLWASNNQLTSINTADLHSIVTMDLAVNSISSLSLAGLNTLHDLNCEINQITSLDPTDCTSLFTLACGTNQLTTLDCSALTNLWGLNCNNNQLTTLTFTSLPNPNTRQIECNNNLLTTLQLNAFTLLQDLNCYSNHLETLFIKNNSQLQSLNFYNNLDLQFICVDDFETSSIQYYLDSYGMSATVCNSYCTFTPGGHYNTVFASVKFDADNNGCDISDSAFSNIRVNINDGTNSGAGFTNSNGIAQFYTQAGSFDITPSIENPTWFNFSPTTVNIPLANNNNNTTTQNFCITANGIHPDVEVVIAPITSARPGFDAVYKIVYKNKGNQTLSGNVAFSYDDTVLDFVSSTVIPSSQSTGLLTYNYTNLLPFENRSFYITLHVNTPTDSPSVNIGDQLSFNATASPIAGDEIPSDNTFQYHQTVVGSFDPNDITCIEGNVVPPTEIGNYLHYAINFENTGTADAENIVVKDIIDTTQFDVNSLQILNSSDPVTAKLTGNIAEFIFQNINLHSGGHGNILIKVKSKNTLAQGDTVSKKANIYFDYNAPIDTNLENTTFQSLNNPNFETDASISVYPNPSKGNVNINCNNTIKSVQLYDVQGRLLQTNMVNENKTVIDISGKSNGIYFIKVLSDKGIVVQKIMKE